MRRCAAKSDQTLLAERAACRSNLDLCTQGGASAPTHLFFFGKPGQLPYLETGTPGLDGCRYEGPGLTYREGPVCWPSSSHAAETPTAPPRLSSIQAVVLANRAAGPRVRVSQSAQCTFAASVQTPFAGSATSNTPALFGQVGSIRHNLPSAGLAQEVKSLTGSIAWPQFSPAPGCRDQSL